MYNTQTNVGVISTTGTPIPGVVGWTYEDAAQENKNRMRDERFARLSRKSRVRAVAKEPVLSDAEFLALTGWTREDALSEAIELRRDERLFGRRYH